MPQPRVRPPGLPAPPLPTQHLSGQHREGADCVGDAEGEWCRTRVNRAHRGFPPQLLEAGQPSSPGSALHGWSVLLAWGPGAWDQPVSSLPTAWLASAMGRQPYGGTQLLKTPCHRLGKVTCVAACHCCWERSGLCCLHPSPGERRVHRPLPTLPQRLILFHDVNLSPLLPREPLLLSLRASLTIVSLSRKLWNLRVVLGNLPSDNVSHGLASLSLREPPGFLEARSSSF